MQIPVSDHDDPEFITLLQSFVEHYIVTTSARRVILVHIDNWFGERWLGFAGTFIGSATIRQRYGKLSTDQKSLAIPPFRPSRVLSVNAFEMCKPKWNETTPPKLHVEKNGGICWTLFRHGIYFWYSGSTKSNTSGSLMVYEVNAGGQDAWYIHFDQGRDQRWQPTKCRNTQLAECRKISNEHDSR